MRTLFFVCTFFVAGILQAQEYPEYYEPEVDTLWAMDSMYNDTFNYVEENTPKADLPDLEAYFLAPTRSGRQSMRFDIPIQNKGSQASASTTLKIQYQWTDAKGQKKSVHQLIDIPKLQAGELLTLRATIKDRSFKNDAFANQVSGITQLIIDPKNYVKEGDEGNNVLRSSGYSAYEEPAEEVIQDESVMY